MISTLALICLVAAGAPGGAPQTQPAAAAAHGPEGPDPSAVIMVERAFARTTAGQGIRRAFLDYLAEDAVIFRPQAVEGRKWYRDRPETKAALSWAPAYAAISRAGDLGWTTGPWEYRKAPGDDTDVGYGDYVSVWKRQADGSLRAVIDLGVQHVRPALPPATLAAGRSPGAAAAATPSPAVDVKAAREDLLAADRALSQSSAERGAVPALSAVASEEIRILRQGSLPFVGREAIGNALGALPGTLTWSPTRADVSASGDLGYTYGTAQFLPAGGTGGHAQNGSYVRIWKRASAGAWKVALDILIPIPEAESKPGS